MQPGTSPISIGWVARFTIWASGGEAPGSSTRSRRRTRTGCGIADSRHSAAARTGVSTRHAGPRRPVRARRVHDVPGSTGCDPGDYTRGSGVVREASRLGLRGLPGSIRLRTATWWRSGTTVERYRCRSVLLRLLQRNRVEEIRRELKIYRFEIADLTCALPSNLQSEIFDLQFFVPFLRTQATEGWDFTAPARFFRIRRPRDNHPPGSVAAV